MIDDKNAHRPARKVLEMVGRALLVLVSLGVAEAGCTSLVFSSFKQWQVYVPTLLLAVILMWLATRGLPLVRKQSKGPPKTPNL